MINQIECFIDEYTVTVTANAVADSYDFTFVDGCNTLRDDCRMRAYLLKVATDWLVSEGSAQDVYADCCGERSCCPGAGDGVTFTFSDKLLTVATNPAIVTPGTALPLTGTIVLPFDCTATTVFA